MCRVLYAILTQRLVVVFGHEALGLFCACEFHEAVVVLTLARDRRLGPWHNVGIANSTE